MGPVVFTLSLIPRWILSVFIYSFTCSFKSSINMCHLPIKCHYVRPWRCRDSYFRNSQFGEENEIWLPSLPLSPQILLSIFFLCSKIHPTHPSLGLPIRLLTKGRDNKHLRKWVEICGGEAWKLKMPPALKSDRARSESWLAMRPEPNLGASLKPHFSHLYTGFA